MHGAGFLTEVLSDPELLEDVACSLLELPLIEVQPGFWKRAGVLRAKVLGKGREAQLGDALIAQICNNRSIPLLTRDRGFRHFEEAAELEVVVNLV